MSETTPDNNERNPFTRPGFILSTALVIALIAAVLVIAFLPNNDEPRTAAPTTAASTSLPASTEDKAEESVCGLPGNDDTAIGTAPESDWELVGTTVVPSAPETIGPGVVDADGFRSCFAQTPAGALFAAANLIGLGSLPEIEIQRKIAEQLVVPSAGQQAAIEDLATSSEQSSPPSSSIQISGFKVLSYTDQAAKIDIGFTTRNGATGHALVPLQWVDGDWKVEIADNGQLLNEPTQLNDLSDYIPWSGI
jgi:hypothetical protein